LWSERILLEVEDTIEALRPDLEPERIRRRTAAMKSAFEDANVTGWEQVAAGLDLPDPDDRHARGGHRRGSASHRHREPQRLPRTTARAAGDRSPRSGRLPARPARPLPQPNVGDPG